MPNSRIKNVDGLPGITREAIASSINIMYNPLSPLDTTINFAYQDFLRNSEGDVVGFANDKYDHITLRLGDILEWDLGNDSGAVGVLEAIRVATDLAHNIRAGA